MTDTVMTSKATRTDIDQIVETEGNIDRTEVGLDMKKNYRSNFRGNVRGLDRQKSRGEYRNNYRNEGYEQEQV